VYLLDLPPFLDLVGGGAGPVRTWSEKIPRQRIYVSSLAFALAEHIIESEPLGSRSVWLPRLDKAKSEFEARTFDFEVRDVEVWAKDVMPLELTGTEDQTGTDGREGYFGRDQAAHLIMEQALRRMIVAQALGRRYILVTKAGPYHDRLKVRKRLEWLDPYQEGGG